MASNAFTVDVEDWFHICGVEDRLPRAAWAGLPSRVEDTTRWLLDDLARANVTATFFVVGWVAERFPALVGDIARAGHEVGAHSYEHRRTWELGPEEFAADLTRNLLVLGDGGVHDVRAFRAPEWSADDRAPWAPALLRQAGFTVDASRAPVPVVGSRRYPRRPYPLATPAGPILEVPPLVVDRWGCAYPLGWGWALRHATPSHVARAVERQNRRGDPAVLTVHPWEIDPNPPRVRLPLPLAFAHYHRLGGFRQRLRALLASIDLGPVRALPDVQRWVQQCG